MDLHMIYEVHIATPPSPPHTHACVRSSCPSHLGDAKVTQLEQPTAGHEDILALDVAVEDLAVVHVLQAEADLGVRRACKSRIRVAGTRGKSVGNAERLC
eukprot:360637-Chlamydomonas_euryale.AAC.11